MPAFATRTMRSAPSSGGPVRARGGAPARPAPGNQAVQSLLRAPAGVVQRQADVRRAPAGLTCVLTTEPAPASAADVLFPLGSHAVDTAGRAAIAGFVSQWAAAGGSDDVRVDGYASVDGGQATNWRLSCDRAEAVKAELATAGVPAGRIVTLAHGPSSEASTPAANRRAALNTVAAALPALQGPALAQTPAAASSALPADTVRSWSALAAAGDLEGALRVVVWAMEQRGEISRALMATQAVPGAARVHCRLDRPFLLEPVSGAFTDSCGCMGPAGNRTPNPRVRIHPDLVTKVSIGASQPRQTRAEVLHSTLLHEFRHVRQFYETCNGTGTGSGPCTDCNDPTEMDAYLAEMEAGYDTTALRHAWVRVFVNWNFLSTRQQGTFQARRDAAQARIDALFPGVNWSADSQVQAYQAFCQGLAATAGPGFCDHPLARR